MDENSLLLGIQEMRSDSDYHAAEVLRRETDGGAEAMAAAPSDSREHAAVRLLIVTWESIAVLMRGVRAKDKIYEVTPICHMYEVLEPAIRYFRKETPEYAANFEKLNVDYRAWLKKKKKGASYESAACGGMHARFG
ncbi:hypothetical protein [Bradyrhizobium retamae]|uniref:Uncharacterized protein n=1 Tax=Bradyrhizobium retamae TaxID=1300035 RepID=A0A0R3MMW4_9BRAD|nr:hypothetical protein [Bradyrhizobium retamae]KRR18784.1 hypothetical protein CQ13_10090 [Bradyrhizobium retamae]